MVTILNLSKNKPLKEYSTPKLALLVASLRVIYGGLEERETEVNNEERSDHAKRGNLYGLLAAPERRREDKEGGTTDASLLSPPGFRAGCPPWRSQASTDEEQEGGDGGGSPPPPSLLGRTTGGGGHLWPSSEERGTATSGLGACPPAPKGHETFLVERSDPRRSLALAKPDVEQARSARKQHETVEE